MLPCSPRFLNIKLSERKDSNACGLSFASSGYAFVVAVEMNCPLVKGIAGIRKKGMKGKVSGTGFPWSTLSAGQREKIAATNWSEHRSRTRQAINKIPADSASLKVDQGISRKSCNFTVPFSYLNFTLFHSENLCLRSSPSNTGTMTKCPFLKSKCVTEKAYRSF